MLPVHAELLRGGVRALVLSGDHDYVVPFTGTRDWVYNSGLGLRERPGAGWRAWRVADRQVGGYAVTFEPGPLTFATVKGAGHMAAQTSPAATLALLRKWLDGDLY
jgi:pimeloyl-ACP methyl ester carboxylesterase